MKIIPLFLCLLIAGLLAEPLNAQPPSPILAPQQQFLQLYFVYQSGAQDEQQGKYALALEKYQAVETSLSTLLLNHQIETDPQIHHFLHVYLPQKIVWLKTQTHKSLTFIR